MKKNALILLLISLLPVVADAQVYLGGTVRSGAEALPGAQVLLKESGEAVRSDAAGRYQFRDLRPGAYTLVAFALGFNTWQQEIRLSGDSVLIDISLDSLGYALDAVLVQAERERSFGIRRLEGIEGTAIYEGKKTEVIVLQDISANKSVNNPRQIFAKVAGLNIWESDCGGLQLGIGGRGLSPNRSSNFNTRQNGYDISADALGYPESYYTPPTEALDRIEVVRGAASLQYGPQFGGMINFVFKDGPLTKKAEWTSRQTGGSFNLFSSFNSLAGSLGRWRYYTFYQFKHCDCWRPNSTLNQHTAYGSLSYRASEALSLRAEYTFMRYLA
ncbi:MAG: TonB-dependent receptor, partial [Bacteroidetes bacterium]